ncbi:MAG: LLM class flavin-dependent oxidoreductase [Acetobacteraceae bacterium]|nr:LLM class flavin-dependent oxidoreductase [Acetobacteraceae bacterium]
MNAWWAGLTKRLRMGALGYVMSTQDPVRVAEECAILDHILEGRFFAGFARGYQARWTNILGQHYNSKATLSDGSADDPIAPGRGRRRSGLHEADRFAFAFGAGGRHSGGAQKGQSAAVPSQVPDHLPVRIRRLRQSA